MEQWKPSDHYQKPLSLETKLYDWSSDANVWMKQNCHWSIYLGLVYLALIYGGRKVMENRKPFTLRGPLALWNIFMAVFSLVVTIRTLPYVLTKLRLAPWHSNVCVNDYDDTNANQDYVDPLLTLWARIFVITKPMEFIDTLFIVLRKQHLVI